MPSYADHISEVFIRPIRSVLAIDDRFPTLDLLVSKDAQHKHDENTERLSKLLQFCRTKKPEWLFDVHDGKGIGEGSSPLSTMRQCGWLILDYKLDGDSGDGSRSISALRSLARSDHFNLVAIYTADQADVVFRDVVVALSNLASTVPLTEQQRSDVDGQLREWEDSEPNIEESLSKEISGSVCFEFLSNKNSLIKNKKNSSALAGFNRLMQSGGKVCKIDSQLLLNYFIQKHLSLVIPKESETFQVEFSQPESTRKWIYARNIFVSVEQKTTEPELLFDGIIASLKEWKPSPNQLIIAKIRAELEASGLILDREVVKDKNLQAFWLHRLLDSDPREDAHYVGALVDRQSEILGDRLRSKLVEFTASIISNLKNEGNSVDVTKSYLGIDPTNVLYKTPGIIAHNTHVSTKPPAGKNLTSGHVVKIQEQPEASFWICLSPACDLEAGRKEGRDLKVLLQPWMPATLLKLHRIPEQTAIKCATRGWVLFLDIDGRKEQFSYYKDANDKSNPTWEEVFAKDEGRMLQDNNLIEITRIRKPVSPVDLPIVKEFVLLGGTQVPKKPSDMPVFEEFNATVVAQLRTEYAASLTLRFTAHLSRIGLDYHGEPTPTGDT